MQYIFYLLRKVFKLLPLNVRKYISIIIYPYTQRYISSKLRKHIKSSTLIIHNHKPITFIGIIGLFRSTIGHAKAAQLLNHELEKTNNKKICYDVTKFLDAPINNKDTNKYEDDLSDCNTLVIVLNPEELLHVLWKMPREFIVGKKIIGYFVWELEAIPQKWELVKGIIHEIWTPTRFCAEPLKKFFDVPVKIVPHPAAISPPPPTDKARGLALRQKLGIPEDAFLAIQSFTFASSLERKNVIGAISAFAKAFNKKDNAFMVARYLSSDLYPKSLERLKEHTQSLDTNIILLDGGGDIQNLYDLYSAADLYISLHRAEGFGLNIAESMLINLPVMTTNWSGNIEFTNDETAFMIPAKLIKVKDKSNIYKMPKAKWADPDLEYAADILCKIKENPALLEEKSVRAKEYIIHKLSGGAAKKALYD
jgi:glycosyltransferase involved in cell wall biosynthesis